MTRCLTAAAALLLVVTGVQLLAPHADAEPVRPIGTRAVGHSYVILWATIAAGPRPRSVTIAGHDATRRGTTWEVVLTGPRRNVAVRRVDVTVGNHSWATRVRFTEVEDW